jgi:hypothetical protein
LIQHPQRLSGNRPVTDTFPENFAAISNCCERCYEQQDDSQSESAYCRCRRMSKLGEHLKPDKNQRLAGFAIAFHLRTPPFQQGAVQKIIACLRGRPDDEFQYF